MILRVGQRIEIRGCMWVEEHWEFDAPCVLYRGAKGYGFGGNAGHIDIMIESALIDACIHVETPRNVFTNGELHEFKWRRWCRRGFSRRKAATHVRVLVEITEGPDGLEWDELEHEEQRGPFVKAAK